MNRFLFILASIPLIFTACENSRFKDLFRVDLEDALIYSENEPFPMSVDAGWLVFSERKSDSYWYIRLEIPNMDKIVLGPEHEYYQDGDHYLFCNGEECIELSCGEIPYIGATLSSGSKLEYSPERKMAQMIKKTLKKCVFSPFPAVMPGGATFPVEAVDTLEEFAEMEYPEVADSIEEEAETIEWDEMIDDEEVTENYYLSPKARGDANELYVGSYNNAKTGTVSKFSIYEGWMLEHFNSTVEPRKYYFKGIATYEGKSYRHYVHDDDYYALVSPDTNDLIMFWAFTFDGNKSNNVSRYTKGDLSLSSTPPANMDNSYQQLQQQQYYQLQQKMQREQMYLSQYRTWENTVISHWNTLTSMREGAARVSVRMNFRNAQSEMRQIRLNAQVEGIHIPVSAWESASVPLGYE